MAVNQAIKWIAQLNSPVNPVLNEREQMIAHQILKELQARLGFLEDVG